MSRLKLRSWLFGLSEEVELYWHGMPFLNSNGLWMFKCLFKKGDGTFKEHTFPFGTLPHLRIGQAYIDGDFAEKPGNGSMFEVKLSNSVKFEICKAFDFPRSLYAFDKYPAPSYGNLPICKFEVSGIIYYIPCTEIVRSILAPNKMLVNQILRPEGLGHFIESYSTNRNQLTIKFTENFDLKLLKDDMISYFVWLRFDKAAERSWNSVYKNMVIEASKKSGDITYELRRGVPIVVMPPLSGSSVWTFRGMAYKNHRLILELLHRSALDVPFTDIECFHPKLERHETDGRPRYVKDPEKKPTDENDVELDITGQGSERHPNNNIIEQPPVMFSFKKLPRVFKKRNKTRKIHTGDVVVIGTKLDDEGNADNIGTTQDWVLGGCIPQIEFSTLKMVDTNLSKGLEEFLKLIEYIQMNNKRFSVSLSIIPLPAFKSFSYYEDGSIRTCAIVQIIRQGHMPCYIIEVGRADDWSISTLLIKPVRSENANLNVFEGVIQRLLRNLTNNNGHWDREFFRNENSYVLDTAKHMSGQPIFRWAERIVEKL